MDTSIVVGLICSVLGAIFGYIAFSRNKAHDNRDEGKQDGVILTELGYIKANTDEIKIEQKEQRKINNEVFVRLTSVEGTVKRAHERVDHAEKRVDYVEKQVDAIKRGE